MPENGAHFSGEGHLIEGQVEGDINKKIVPVAVDADGHLIIDLETSTITIGDVQIVDNSSGNTAKVDNEGDLQVDINNFPASSIVTEANVDKNFGTWSYYAGTNGTVTVGSGQRVIGIGVYSMSGGTLTINGGASLPIPSSVSININPLGNITAPTIVFTGTDSYFVEVVA